MKVVHTIKALQDELKGKTNIVLVPTMGNLHAGHLHLMQKASEIGDTVVASIFVNRLQFGPNEDFDQYPRTLEEDCKKLQEQGVVDIVFAPSESDMYPQPQTFRVVPTPTLANILEGFYRPGFFEGVCTVVMKLFSIVRPNSAVFGKKDYQQLRIITEMVKQFGMPIRIVPAELQRNEHTGLALSSRNRYLSEQEKEDATLLYKVVKGVKDSLESGASEPEELEEKAIKILDGHGWSPDYVAIVRREDLLAPTKDDLLLKTPLVVLAAAKIGTTRLIDNIEVF